MKQVPEEQGWLRELSRNEGAGRCHLPFPAQAQHKRAAAGGNQSSVNIYYPTCFHQAPPPALWQTYPVQSLLYCASPPPGHWCNACQHPMHFVGPWSWQRALQKPEVQPVKIAHHTLARFAGLPRLVLVPAVAGLILQAGPAHHTPAGDQTQPPTVKEHLCRKGKEGKKGPGYNSRAQITQIADKP